jgi:hypothetical protein
MVKNISEDRYAGAKDKSQVYHAKTDRRLKCDESHKVAKNNNLRTGFKGKGKQMV